MKNIVLCFDGTNGEYGLRKTNVVHTCELAVADAEQLVFYDPGVGAVEWRYIRSALRAGYRKITGNDLQNNVEDGYRFLMEHYAEGDRIYLFGFSRGAFTARALGGMLWRCGLLRRGLGNLVEQASKIYNRPDNALDTGFKQLFCRPCPVYFIGVWDTVKSLILNEGRRFHDTRLDADVRYGYHALALDERRRHFLPLLWDETQIHPQQTIEQVWFAGVHSDVGGGYDERGLSDLSLGWMMEKASACGLRLHPEVLAALRGDPHARMHTSYTGGWRVLGKHERQVPPGALIHESVKQRITGPTDYRPVKPLPKDARFIR